MKLNRPIIEMRTQTFPPFKEVKVRNYTAEYWRGGFIALSVAFTLFFAVVIAGLVLAPRNPINPGRASYNTLVVNHMDGVDCYVYHADSGQVAMHCTPTK